MSWTKKLPEPIRLRDGRELHTLSDARTLAYPQVRLNTTTKWQLTIAGAALPAVLFGPGTSTFNYSHIKVGFTGGGGIEWMFLPNWSVKAEALYYDLGRSSIPQNFTQTFLPTLLGIPIVRTNTITTCRKNGVMARAGINYHFSWGAAAPVVARY